MEYCFPVQTQVTCERVISEFPFFHTPKQRHKNTRTHTQGDIIKCNIGRNDFVTQYGCVSVRQRYFHPSKSNNSMRQQLLS